MLDSERKKIAETETWRGEQEELVRLESESIKNAKVKLAAAKSAREFAMANREIDHKRRSMSSREDEVLKVIEAMETTRKALEAQAAQVDEIGKGIEVEESQITEQIKELEVRASESAQGRDEVSTQIDKQLLRKYEAVFAKRRGIAVVSVVDGACGGCNMKIPPQLNNILARFESVEACPACYRLLYRIELVDEAV